VGKASEEGAVKKPTPQEISDAKARLASSLESFDRESASLLKEAIGLDAVGLCDRKAAIEAIAASIIADAQTCGMRSKAKDRISSSYLPYSLSSSVAFSMLSRPAIAGS
jgi:hypothetical protein